jgi:hypothetical protein
MHIPEVILRYARQHDYRIAGVQVITLVIYVQDSLTVKKMGDRIMIELTRPHFINLTPGGAPIGLDSTNSQAGKPLKFVFKILL